MVAFDWMYHRKNCTTCAKATDFLTRHKVEADEVIDARKDRMDRWSALALAHMVDELFVTKGKKVIHLNLRDNRPGDDELAALLLGPSGNLRAPTIRRGRKLIVGFDADTYKKVLVD